MPETVPTATAMRFSNSRKSWQIFQLHSRILADTPLDYAILGIAAHTKQFAESEAISNRPVRSARSAESSRAAQEMFRHQQAPCSGLFGPQQTGAQNDDEPTNEKTS